MAASIKQRDLNLLLALDRKQDKGSRGHGIALLILGALVLILILVGCAAYYLLQVASLKDEKADIKNYLDDPAVAAQLQETESAKSQAESMQAQSEILAGAMDNIATYPELSDAQIEKILSIADEYVTLDAFVYDKRTGALNLSGRTSAATKVAILVTQLRMSQIFGDVTYSGYIGGDITEYGKPTLDEETGEEIQHSTTTRAYNFNIVALVKSPADSIIHAVATDEDTEEGGEG